MNQITIQESGKKHHRLTSLVKEGQFNNLSELYSLGADLILLINEAISTTHPRYFDLKVLEHYTQQSLKSVKAKDISKTTEKLKELSLALKLRVLIAGSMADSKRAYINLSEVFARYSYEMRNLETSDIRTKKAIFRDLKMQLSALDEFLRKSKMDDREFKDYRSSTESQKALVEYTSRLKPHSGYEYEEESRANSIISDPPKMRDFTLKHSSYMV